jgi:ribose-phosphate pyrophosphokinase
MSMPIVFALPGGDLFADRLSLAIQGERAGLDVHRFPDGETLVRLDADVSGRCVVFAGSLDHPDEKTLPLLFAADAARDLGASQVILVAPYLGYMRQDKRFQPGEAITSRTYASLISSAVDALITVDPHLHRYHSLGEIYRIPTRVVASAPLIAQWVRDNVARPLLIGPDSESAQWVAEVAKTIDAPYTVLQKLRHGDRDVSVSLPDAAQWADKNPVLIDDIIASGHTLMQAAVSLRSAGFAPPVCIGVHALFAQDAHQQLLASGVSRVVTCDTVPHVSNVVSVVGPIARALKELLAVDAAALL